MFENLNLVFYINNNYLKKSYVLIIFFMTLYQKNTPNFKQMALF